MKKAEFLPGLASVSFRQHTPGEIIEAAANARLGYIEWGGDIHVPPHDTENAVKTARHTADAGLTVSSYGSYYKIGITPLDEFRYVLETAVCLGAPIIRVWGYDRPLQAVESARLRELANDAKNIAELAKAAGIRVCMECHSGTLTEHFNDASRFVKMVNTDNFGMYWQPNQYNDHRYNLDSANALAPVVSCIHAFNWDAKNRYPLSSGTKVWKDYLSVFASNGGKYPVLLEFMPDDMLTSLKREADALISILRGVE